MSFGGFETAAGIHQGSPFPDGEIVELPLLLPTGQAAALEGLARRRGLTVAELTRQLIGDFLDPFGEHRFPEGGHAVSGLSRRPRREVQAEAGQGTALIVRSRGEHG